ncbi:MAG: phage holin family protein [Candidatus Eisenbacteria bacterium]|nr:phage holin family protein [Candidatus Eisenbacteria bacterium]
MRTFLIHWLTITVALGATAWILPGVEIGSVGALLVSALILGFLNAGLKPLLVLLTLPITILTLGIFYLILNGVLFGLTALLVPGFRVAGFGWAVLGAVIMGLLSMFIGSFSPPQDRPLR